MSYWIGRSGKKYTYDEIGKRISREHPNLNGRHIFEQIAAVGLANEFELGRTPHMLPYTFTPEGDDDE